VTAPTGYPHHLAGAPAPAPAAPDARLLGMAHKAHVRHLAAVEGAALLGAGGWPTNPRPAAALLTLQAECNALDPARNKASDGMLGDARHQAEGKASDHNGWVKLAGVGVVRAFDITNDPALDLAARFERMRVLVTQGQLPQLLGGGYLILNGRITAPDFAGWREYTGDPHVSHGHVSVGEHPAEFDDRRSWLVFSSEPAPAPPAPVEPAPAPAAPAGQGWTGPDLTGTAEGLRGQAAGQSQGPQSNGERVQALQEFLNRFAPAYSRLTVDGWYGTQTAGVLAEFARRSSIAGADGLNIGPKLAAALYRAGFERRLSAARVRVLGHAHR
jgi:hypothetical protein